jgi:hypothetical protein
MLCLNGNSAILARPASRHWDDADSSATLVGVSRHLPAVLNAARFTTCSPAKLARVAAHTAFRKIANACRENEAKHTHDDADSLVALLAVTAVVRGPANIKPQHHAARLAPMAVVPQYVVPRKTMLTRLLCRLQAFSSSLIPHARCGVAVCPLAGRTTLPTAVAGCGNGRAAVNARHMMTVNAHARMLPHLSSLSASHHWADRLACRATFHPSCREWHDAHSVRRFVTSSVPPWRFGTMWSTCARLPCTRHPHTWHW